jgi:hypothetical protein
MSSYWFKDGKIVVDGSGLPIWCASCPCGSGPTPITLPDTCSGPPGPPALTAGTTYISFMNTDFYYAQYVSASGTWHITITVPPSIGTLRVFLNGLNAYGGGGDCETVFINAQINTGSTICTNVSSGEFGPGSTFIIQFAAAGDWSSSGITFTVAEGTC